MIPTIMIMTVIFSTVSLLHFNSSIIAYSEADADWVLHTALPKLESGGTDKSFKLCVHHRDFTIGAAVADNIIESVQRGFIPLTYSILGISRPEETLTLLSVSNLLLITNSLYNRRINWAIAGHVNCQ
jgi:hypothetical protein